MSLKLPGCRRLAVGLALACGVVAVPAATVVASAASGSPATVANCRASSTDVWAAVEGDGTAGTVFYELEFSNVGAGPAPCVATRVCGRKPVRSRDRQVRVAQGFPEHRHPPPRLDCTCNPGVVDTGALCSVRALRRQDSSRTSRQAFPRQAKPTRSRTSPYASAPISRR